MKNAMKGCLHRRWLGALLPLLLSLWATQAQSAAAPSLSGSMGSVTVGDEQFFRLAFRPDIPLGNWGLALDLELFFDPQGQISSHGWKFATGTEALDSFLRKIYYVRYGRPEQDVYARVGALDQVTLGYGLIMSDYRNTLRYPGLKQTGLQFKFRNLGNTGFGLEGMVNNFQDFQHGGPLIGLRALGRVAGKLELGLTYVIDLDQYSGLLDSELAGYRELPDSLRAELIRLNDRYGDDVFPIDHLVRSKPAFNRKRADPDRFAILGADLGYPLVQSGHFKLVLYGQAAMLMDDDDELSPAQAEALGIVPGNRKAEGWGLAAPGVWLDMGLLRGQLEFRHFRDDFDGGYFDNLYDLDRVRLNADGQVQTKDARLQRDTQVSGVFGRLDAMLGQYIDASASYQYLTGADDPKQQLAGAASLSSRTLADIPRLSLARAYYQKNNIGTQLNRKGDGKDGMLESTEDTFYGYALGLEMTSGVSVIWDTRFIFERPGPDQRLKRRKLMTIETAFTF